MSTNSKLEIITDELLLPQQIQPFCMLENLIFNATDEDIEDAINLYESKKGQIPKDSIYPLITHASIVRPFNFKQFEKLWRYLGKTEDTFQNSLFLEYLIKLGIQPETSIQDEITASKTPEEIAEVFPKGSLGNAIFCDDYDTVVYLSAEKDFFEKKIDLGDDQMSLISFAAFCGSLKVFKYFTINMVEISRETVEMAVRGGNPQIIAFIEQKGMTFNNTNKCALRYHRNEVFQWLEENYTHEEVGLTYCLDNFNTQVFVYLVESGKGNIESRDKYGNSPMINASWYGRLDLMQYILDKGADVNGRAPGGWDPLISAAYKNRVHSIKFLVKAGANLESRDKWGGTSIMSAANEGHIEAVQVLLELGANIDATDSEGSTALFNAVKEGIYDLVKLLIEKGADVKKRDNEGKSILDYADDDEIKDLILATSGLKESDFDTNPNDEQNT